MTQSIPGKINHRTIKNFIICLEILPGTKIDKLFRKQEIVDLNLNMEKITRGIFTVS